MPRKYKDINIMFQVPIVKEEETKDGNTIFTMLMNVRGQKDYLERFLAGYISNKTSIKSLDKNEDKYDVAIYMLREYVKFAIMDMAKLKTYPLTEK